jgi:DNA-binding protein YbaB
LIAIEGRRPVDNDAARHELGEALALLQEHMAELAIVERKRADLSATATVAEGTVVVTVDAQGVVSQAAIDESYFDDHDLDDLGNFFTAAAQAATRDVARRSAELLAPLAERRARFPSLSDIVDGAPDIRDLLQQFRRVGQAQPVAGDEDRGRDERSFYPTVRS